MRRARFWSLNKHRRRRQTPGAGLLLAGAGLGATAGFLLDPAQGKRRRHMLGDRAVRSLHVTTDASETVGRDVANRMKGIAASATSPLRGHDNSDQALVARVRTQLGRVASHPSSVFVLAEDGNVTLSGPVPIGEADRIIGAVQSVQGVTSVDNALTEHLQSEGVPGLQGQANERRMRGGLQQEYWSPALRFIAGTAGIGLAIAGMTRRGLLMKVPAALGGIVALRAMTNMPLRRIFGIGAGRRAVTLHKIINLNVPVDEVFGVWSNFERFPSFMDGVLEVNSKDSGISRWKVRGPMGAPVSFNTEITRFVPNQEIAWKTTPGSAVQHAGIVKFETDGPDATRVDVRMSYNPMAGAIGHAVASVFGANPKQTMDQDLARLKSLLEEGATTAHGQTITADEV